MRLKIKEKIRVRTFNPTRTLKSEIIYPAKGKIKNDYEFQYLSDNKCQVHDNNIIVRFYWIKKL